MQASDPVISLKGIGPALVKKLAGLQIHRVADLLWHLPLRYEDRTRVVPVSALRPGMAALLVVRVEQAEIRYGRRRSLLVSATDSEARITLRFFHFYDSQLARLQTPGNWLRIFGEVRAGHHGLEIVHPEYRVIADPQQGIEVDQTLTPVYPTTSGLSQNKLRQLTTQVLDALQQPDFLPELLPQEIRNDQQLGGLADAVRVVHAPPPDADIAALLDGTHPAVRRLAFEEILARQLGLRRRRRQIRACKARPLAGTGTLLQQFHQQLGFALTAAQRRVVAQALGDMARDVPMLRLLQGDVGSGKTVVAAIAAITAAEAGWQTALMAPTELLAEQHFNTMQAWLEPLGVRVVLLTGSRTKAQRRAALGELASGEPMLAVGTHALFQADVETGRLGLILVDEQHRFGVEQRKALRDKGSAAGYEPHQLVMTATPIPRTLAMSAYADLDTSVIDELPPGRTPVTTVAVPETRRQEVLNRVISACAAGRQAYWVCPLVEESELVQCRAAEATAEELATTFPDLQIGLAHGRMKSAAKEQAMRAFKSGNMDLLVATTVIEVGVDVPNASLMIIENAERLGLAQLHQLRGRVGRGHAKSYCVLMYHAPLGELARARLSALRQTNDGFDIASEDLRLRGPGEVLGTRQTGAVEFRLADLVRDAAMLPAAQAAADRMLDAHPDIADRLIERWAGEDQEYANI